MATQIGKVLNPDLDDRDDRDDGRRGDRDDRRKDRDERRDRDDKDERLEDIFDDRQWGGSGGYGLDDDDEDDGGSGGGRDGPRCGRACRISITAAVICVAIAIIVGGCYCYHKNNKNLSIPPPQRNPSSGSYGNAPVTPENEFGEVIKPRPVYDPHVPMFN